MLTTGDLGAARVVEVRQPVAEPRPEVQQGRRGRVRHPRVAIGGSGRDALEQVRIARISGTESSAATKWISDVPGFVKHVVTPASTSVRISAWAPLGISCLENSRIPRQDTTTAVGVENGCVASILAGSRAKRGSHRDPGLLARVGTAVPPG